MNYLIALFITLIVAAYVDQVKSYHGDPNGDIHEHPSFNKNIFLKGDPDKFTIKELKAELKKLRPDGTDSSHYSVKVKNEKTGEYEEPKDTQVVNDFFNLTKPYRIAYHLLEIKIEHTSFSGCKR
ncbi:hypothetical protein Ddc_13904 [Ditylenchus destructor]|nr:hypothetical protein Ddc_13904 [Ditylenchus destructor]